MKKTIMFIIMLAVCLLIVPGVYAEEEHEYATVVDITNEDTFKDGTRPVVKGSKEATTTITVDAATFQLLGTEGNSENVSGEQRPGGYAWIGFRVTMPEEASGVTLNEESESEPTFDKYLGFKVSSLTTATNGGANVTKTYTLKWTDKDGETEMTQTINIVIVPEKIVLYDDDNKFGEDESAPVWSEDIYHKTKGDVKLTITAVYSGEGVGDSYTDYLYLPKDSKMPTEASLREGLKEITGTKYAIEGFYSDVAMTKKFDFTKTLGEDTTLYIKIVDAKKETNPATGDNLLTYVSLSVVALTGALGTALYLRKVNA